jgi:alpha-tubulin suppressor-like RCC1 family protein
LKVQAYAGSSLPSSIVSGYYSLNGQVAAGTQHTVTLRTNGGIWSWGNNSAGQLGYGNTTTTGDPGQVSASGAAPILSLNTKTVPFESNGLSEVQNG